jgi:hypothetical protein
LERDTRLGERKFPEKKGGRKSGPSGRRKEGRKEGRKEERRRDWYEDSSCEPGWKFCTCVHRFAQRFDENLIDGENGKDYFALQIEPGSLRTLRINLEGAANLTVVAPRD